MTVAPVIWADSFGSQDLSAYLTAGTFTFGATGGRGGRTCLNYGGNGPSWTIRPPLGVSCGLWVLNVAVKPSGALPDFSFLDGSGGTRATLTNSGGGGWLVSINGTSYGTTPTIPQGVWTHLIFRVFFSATVGLFDVQLNESSVLSGSGLNTGATFPVIMRGGSTISTAPAICDLVVQASATSTDLPAGDRAVIWLPPSGSGANTGFAHTGAASNWQAVADTPNDGDTSYVSASAAGTKDTYALTNLPAGVLSVHGVVAKWTVRKTDAGSRKVAPLWHIGGTDYEGTPQVMGTNYGQSYQAYPLNPDTSADWTITDINGAELGVELDS